MEIGIQPSLKFGGVDIFDIRFQSLQSSIGVNLMVNLNIEPRLMRNKENPEKFQIFMNVRLVLEQYFELELKAVGYFEYGGEITEEIRKSLISINAPAIMFPYIRSFITNLTSSLGNVTGAISIPPHFFKGEIEELRLEEPPQIAEKQSI
jgi:preprotein translocase subunit SecB